MIISPALWMAFMLVVIVIWQIYLACSDVVSVRKLNISALVVAAVGVGSLIVSFLINFNGVPA